MEIERLSPVIFVDAIEPCLGFWTERLGFSVEASVAPEGKYAFVLLARGGVSVMYQTRASLAEDMKELEERDAHTSICLYVNVDDFDAVEKAVAGAPVVVPRRTTFYGATEIGVREPGGNLIVFAHHAPA
jgi:uncharacterized glyoxalase superfamily protein PhnB